MEEYFIPFQLELQQKLPVVKGNKDYTEFRKTLVRIDEIIRLGKLEEVLINAMLQEVEEKGKRRAKEQGKKYKQLKAKARKRFQNNCIKAFRCGIVRHLTGEAYRRFSCRLAESALFQQFCGISFLEEIKVPAKSTLERYEKMVPGWVIEHVVNHLNFSAQENSEQGEYQKLKLKNRINWDDYFLDTTCIKANIHFPVDWVLLRDGTRTLMRGVRIIRNHGLKNRMADPGEFMRQMNKLSIKMTHTRRRKDSKKKRKKVFRLMKKVIKKVSYHAEKHIELLKKNWKDTDLSEAEAMQIVDRLERILEQLPQAVYQAHERIIGERQIKSKNKILSLYEKEIHVIVRGKANAEVEFGNTLFLGEQRDGVILDWRLYKEQASDDSKMLSESLEKLRDRHAGYQPGKVTADRGFDSPGSRNYLKGLEIKNNICPRSVKRLEEKLQDKDFCECQNRRSQTEARIGIFKNQFLGKPLKSKGFDYRDLYIHWSVLAHNLWLIARLEKVDEKQKNFEKAA